MAEKRMFAKAVIDSDVFLDMPLSTQALYFHLSMKGDDDGFVNNPKKIQRAIGCGDDDMRLLIAKNFIIRFDSGIIVIRHWKINNNLRSDRYKPTIYQAEKSMLHIAENKSYYLGIPTVDHVVTQYSIDKNSIVENRVEEDNTQEPLYKLGKEIITYEQYQRLISQHDEKIVKEIIEKIISHPYYSCLNEETINKWCVEAECYTKTYRKKNRFNNFHQRQYDAGELERTLLLASLGIGGDDNVSK